MGALRFSEQAITNGRNTNDHGYDGYAITPSDTAATYNAQVPYQNGAPLTAQAIYVTGAGNVSVVLDAAGNTAVITAAANSLIPIAVTQIKATSTTATGVYALFRIGG